MTAKKLALALLAGLFLLVTALHAHAVDPSDLVIDRPVVDQAQVLSPATIAELEAQILDHYETSGVQLAVLTIETTGGVPIEDFSIAVADQWGGGAAGRDDGLLFVLAVADRRNRIEVGYGLESKIPDSTAQSILNSITDDLRAGDYDGATRLVVAQLLALSRDGVAADLTRVRSRINLAAILFLLFFLIPTALTIGATSRPSSTSRTGRRKLSNSVIIFGFLVPLLTLATVLICRRPPRLPDPLRHLDRVLRDRFSLPPTDGLAARGVLHVTIYCPHALPRFDVSMGRARPLYDDDRDPLFSGHPLRLRDHRGRGERHHLGVVGELFVGVVGHVFLFVVPFVVFFQ